MQLAAASAAQAAASQQLEAAQRGERAAALTLAALCGQGPGFADELHAPAPLRAAPLALPATLPAALLARRPDVAAALWRVEAEARAIKVARAAFLPNINLAAGLGLASLGAGDLLEGASHYEQFAPAISLPLFGGGRLRANLAGQDAAFDAAVAQYNGVLVQAIHQVADGVSATQSLDRELRAQEQAQAAAALSWKLAQDQLGAGVISEMQALQVQQYLLQADQRLAQLRADRLSAGVSLVVALGGGYVPPADSPTPANVAEIQP
jgi:NodT family efflux transporter outer membrane factor (OMF) lipoprotein